MSNRRIRNVTVPTPQDGEVYTARCAVVADRHDLDLVAGARKATHDLLIASEGRWRRTGVWWTEHIARDGQRSYEAIIETLNDYADEWSAPEYLAYRQELITKLDDPRALLVVAWAITTGRGWGGRP